MITIAPKISVIVPVYNVEKYLDDCITSILQQTFSNFELILVNDGSFDRSAEICDKYTTDERVIVIHKKNNGVSSARNTGLEMAKGEFVTFIDSDDWIHLNMLEQMHKSLSSDIDLVLCCLQKVDKDKEILYKSSFENFGIINCGSWSERDFYQLIHSYAIFPPYCKLFRLSIIKNNSIKFEESLSFGEDFIFNLKYLDFSNKLLLINQVLYNYRSVNSGLSSTFNNKKAYSYKYIKNYLLTYAKNNGFFIGESKKFIINNILKDYKSCIKQLFRSSSNKFERKKAFFLMSETSALNESVRYKDLIEQSKIFVFLIRKNNYMYWYIYSYISYISDLIKVVKNKILT